MEDWLESDQIGGGVANKRLPQRSRWEVTVAGGSSMERDGWIDRFESRSHRTW